MTPLSTLVELPRQIVDSVGAVVGIRWGTEEPDYAVVDRLGPVEIRRYGPRVAAETTVDAGEEQARNIGFRRLAHYIFGGNRSGTSIAMTAPVAQNPETDGGSNIRFFMPSKYPLGTLPRPESDRVRLVEVPAETVAMLRYSGDRSPEAVRRRRVELLDELDGHPYRATGDAFSWFYDPPFTLPFRRRNEIAVPVER
jgi:hypothetical protein